MNKNERMRGDYIWIFANIVKLRERYPDEYIAVENKEVKYNAKTLKKLLTEIISSQEEVDDFAIDYIKEHPTNLLL